MTITATPEPGADVPRVRLDLSGLTGSSVAVTRADADGRTRAVRASPVRLTAGRAVVFDHEAPFGSVVSYAVVEDPASVSALVSLDGDQPWLVHPFRPGSSVQVSGASLKTPDFGAATFAETIMPTSRVLVRPLGGRRPIHVSVGGRGAETGTLVVRTRTGEQEQALRDLIADDVPLLLNVPPALGWGVEPSWISVDSVAMSRRPTHGGDPYRSWSLPFEVTDAPYGAALSEWACADVTATFETCADVTRAYATCVDLTTDTRRVVVA